MTDPATELARLVEEVSGNVVPPAHLPFLAQAADARVRATGLGSLAAYVEALGAGALAGEWGSLLPLVTVNESYLFRTPEQFAALDRLLLPRLLAARAGERRLRVWSAGCARGEEPATLAMVLAAAPALSGWDWRVIATDVDETALAAARRGVYGGRAIAGVPPELRRRFLPGEGKALALAPELLSRIDYRVLNLVREPFADPGGPFDLVFLRNVLIYFRLESQQRVAAMVAGTLAEDGYLFLGPAETLWQIAGELEPVDLGDCFCYRRRSPHPHNQWSVVSGQWSAETKAGHGGSTRAVRRAGVPPADARRLATAPRADENPAPLNEVRRNTDHRPLTTDHTVMGTRERLEEAVRFLLEDRLAEAVELVDQALAVDPSDPDAHALEGFIYDLSGRTEMAIASLRAALYLDPSLFQAQLLLADALRRLGWLDRAQAAYRTVLTLLGGGAARELAALAALPLADRASAAQRARAGLAAW
jgi:chemotaxis protein methyltransferase CheR